MMAGKKNGLVPIKRLVVRNGKTFQQTVYVKPKHADKVDHSKHVEIPSWNFKNSKDFDDELKRINKIADRSERKILKEHLLEHVEHELGLDYGKVPNTEKNAFARNCLKAFSLAKKHLENNPQKPKPKAPEPPSQPSQPVGNQGGKVALTVTKQPNAGKSDYIMERPASKELAKKVANEIGDANLIESLKSVGITWNEVPEAGPNRMRALRALASFIRRGGELGVGKVQEKEKEKEQEEAPKLVIEDKDKPLNKESAYEKDSIQYDYEKAPFHHKLIGLATGILPTDEKTANYLEKLVKSGKMGVNVGEQVPYDVNDANSYKEHIDVGLPKALDDELTKFSTNAESGVFNSAPAQYIMDKEGKMFEGTEYEAKYKEVKNIYYKINKKHNMHTAREGTAPIEACLKILDVLDSFSPSWEKESGVQLYENIANTLTNASSKEEVNKLWDALDVEKWLTKDVLVNDVVEVHSTGANLLAFASTNSSPYHFITKIVEKVDPSSKGKINHADFAQKVKAGEISKKDVLDAIASQLNKEKTFLASTAPMGKKIEDTWHNGGVGHFKSAIKNGEIDKAKFKKDMNETLADFAELSTPEAQHILFNIHFSHRISMFKHAKKSVKMPAVMSPIGIEELNSNKTLEAIVKIHTGAVRKSSEKAKAKFLKDNAEVGIKKEKEAVSTLDSTLFANKVMEALNSGKSIADISKFDLPGADVINTAIKSSLASVSEQEAKKVEEKIQESHSSVHYEFKQKVHGVYRIKRNASEEAYQNWKGSADTNDGKGETGFYYHGTSFGTAQKVLGESGGFKVFKGGSKIKVGSMLGYGVYLAKHSSKSSLYVGDGYMSGNRGVMFLCKASLGNTVTTSKKGLEHNQPYMDKPDVDTVFMDKPHVLNPEWAVKRAEQAVPRLWIDVERVYK